jgi:hypothetical protein
MTAMLYALFAREHSVVVFAVNLKRNDGNIDRTVMKYVYQLSDCQLFTISIIIPYLSAFYRLNSNFIVFY